MRKKIGTRIIAMLFLMLIMYLVTSITAGYAHEQALGGMNRLYDKWVQLERYETKLVKCVDNTSFYANMIVHYEMPAVQGALSEGLPALEEEAKGYFAEMRTIVDALEDGDMAGVTK